MTFSTHNNNIKAIATKKMNALKLLANTSFGQQKESLTLVYRQFVRTSLNYASPAWAPTISDSNKKFILYFYFLHNITSNKE